MKNLSGHGDAPVSRALTFSQGRITIPSGAKVTVGTMKKAALGVIAVSLSALLASCGSSGSAPDGSGSGSITATRTEYKLQSGQFVACDNITNGGARATQTQVAVNFTLAGTIKSVTIGLKGNTNSNLDGNYKTTVSGSELVSLGGNSYRTLFNADSSKNLLPASITVTPTVQKIKVVTTGTRSGSFYAQLDIATNTSSFTLKDQVLNSIPVYSECTIVSTTADDV
ncbi:hypothetical protein [uncultured Deinococcus sp.]|uniref:hypothetical protein n=1 Tax=uncultured Deinococcus sp. TaxID=158789 RepID=UPI0025E1BC70|nr:hypothetical protein [uncultured Deinococcus sp.]